MATFEEMADFVEENGNICNACQYQSDGCDGGVHCGPNGPIYPPCTDTDYEDFLDQELLTEEYERLMEEAK